jgi:hypothetical protein
MDEGQPSVVPILKLPQNLGIEHECDRDLRSGRGGGGQSAMVFQPQVPAYPTDRTRIRHLR